eukprot:93237_1
MNPSCTAHCSNKSNCRCYRCSINHAIHLPNGITDCVVSYIGKYSIYGKIGKRYKPLTQLSPIITDTEDPYIANNHSFIHSPSNILFHCIIGSNPKRLQMKHSTILSAISDAFFSFFRVNVARANTNTDKLIILKTLNLNMSESRIRFIVAECESLQIFEITYDESIGTFEVGRMSNIEAALQSLHPVCGDRLKKAVYFAPVGSLYHLYYFLFESGRLIEVPGIVEMNPYPGQLRCEKAIELSGKFRDIAVGARHALMISEKGRVWTLGDNRFKQCGFSSSMHVMHSPNLLFRNQDIKSIRCGLNCSCVILENGMCHLLGVLRCSETINFSFQKWFTVFQEFEGLSDVIVVDVAFGAQHVIVLDVDGNVYGIGSNEYQQISITNACKVFKSPYKIARKEINMTSTKHRIIKVIADGNKNYFVTNTD